MVKEKYENALVAEKEAKEEVGLRVQIPSGALQALAALPLLALFPE
jgi:8-oxo-dGTP pyrophosphatase MutT (NUDIX family)